MIVGNLAFGIGWWGANHQDPARENLAGKSCGKILRENLVGNSCRKIFRQNLVGRSCRKILWEILAGKSSGKILWENLAGNSCGKILQENLAGRSCGKLLRENLVGISCGKILQENLARKSCGNFLQKNLAGKSCGTRRREKANLRKAVIGGNLTFGIGWWGANQSGSSLGKSCGKILRENLVGKSCGKFLWENLTGNSYGKWCGKFPIPISKPFFKVIFKICNSSRSTSFSLVNVKNSFLKPILNRFSHMTHQIEA